MKRETTDVDALIETMEILAGKEAMAGLARSEADEEAGRVFDIDEV